MARAVQHGHLGHGRRQARRDPRRGRKALRQGLQVTRVPRALNDQRRRPRRDPPGQDEVRPRHTAAERAAHPCQVQRRRPRRARLGHPLLPHQGPPAARTATLVGAGAHGELHRAVHERDERVGERACPPQRGLAAAAAERWRTGQQTPQDGRRMNRAPALLAVSHMTCTLSCPLSSLGHGSRNYDVRSHRGGMVGTRSGHGRA
mmetsp:Transcript_34357/g.94695  ORF Transcript_34357/g.94695 Transcript_34357/m.94695 type:complete len:204 (-) Transcript_34357:136-747(-)